MIKCLAHIEQAGTFMRIARFLTVFSILITTFAFTVLAQRTRRPTPKPKPTPVKLAVNPVVAAAKQQVANQLHNVNVFVDKLGPIAIAIESADKQASERRLKREQMEAHETNKKNLVIAIRGLRQGLVALETDFRTKPQLSQYLSRIQGISSLGAQSEDSAIAGRFVASKDPLRQIATKLNDTLAVLPGALTADNPSNGGQYKPVPANMTETRSVPTTVSQTRPAQTQTVTNAKRDIAIGMTTAEVLSSTWGAPINKRSSTSPNGTTDVWSYPGNKTLYFFNGKLSQIVK